MKPLLLLLMVMGAVAHAQSPSATVSSAPPGHLTGSVHCQDTGRPGRFASIQLVAEQTFNTPRFDPALGNAAAGTTKLKLDAIASSLETAIKNIFDGSNLSTLAGLDGGFRLDKIPPGIYYVIAQLPGYLSPLNSLSQQERMQPDAATLALIAGQARKIIVLPGQMLNVRLDLRRGASLAGRIVYSDGSPAPNATPQLLLRATDGSWKQLPSTNLLPAATDDRGEFRFSGLAPGQYAVKAALPVEQSIIGIGLGQVSTHRTPGDALVVFSGGAFRETGIKPIALAANENRTGIDIIFPLEGLHTIAGNLVAAVDRHPISAGTIELQDPTTKSALRTTRVGQDGTFVLHYVPEGVYVLKVTRAADTHNSPNGLPCGLHCKETGSYGSTALSVAVKGNVSGILLQVPGEPQPP